MGLEELKAETKNALKDFGFTQKDVDRFLERLEEIFTSYGPVEEFAVLNASDLDDEKDVDLLDLHILTPSRYFSITYKGGNLIETQILKLEDLGSVSIESNSEGITFELIFDVGSGVKVFGSRSDEARLTNHRDLLEFLREAGERSDAN